MRGAQVGDDRLPRRARKRVKEPFKEMLIDEVEILRENLNDAMKWISLTKSGVILMKYLLDDFYQACLYFIGKAYARASGLTPDDSVSLEELDRVLRQSGAEQIIHRLLGEGFIVYRGNDRYVINYLRLKEVLEAIEEYARYSKII